MPVVTAIEAQSFKSHREVSNDEYDLNFYAGNVLFQIP